MTSLELKAACYDASIQIRNWNVQLSNLENVLKQTEQFEADKKAVEALSVKVYDAGAIITPDANPQ